MQAPPRRTWPRICLSLAAVGAVLWLYGWLATANQNPFRVRGPQSDYFNVLTKAFLAGHTYLLKEPDPNLLRLADPYDPAQNAPYRLLDASLYDGKYYLYYGPTPVLTLFLPWTVVTRGNDLPLNLAIFLYCAVAFLGAAALFRRVARRHFPDCAWARGPLPILLLGLGNFSVLLLRRPMHYEASIAAAYCWLIITVYLLARATELGPRSRWWLLGGSLAGGLTVGARPNQGFAVLAALVAACLYVWRQTVEPPRRIDRRAAALWLAALAPAGLAVAGLLAYNAVRFGNPLEFGMTYALSAFPLRHWQAFDPDFLLVNLRLYLFSLPGLDLQFPYVRPTDITAIGLPAGYSLVEGVVGVISSLPVLWLIPFTFLVPPWEPDRWRALRGLLLAGAAASLLVLAMLGGANGRYEIDFLPLFTLLAAFGALAVCQRAVAAPWRWLARGAVCILIVAAVCFNLAFAVQELDLLKILNPAEYERLAAVGNQPLLLWERLRGVQHGPVRLTVRFPTAQVGQDQPLVATGSTRGRDVVYAVYPDAEHIQFRLFHAGAGGPTSLPIPLDYGRDHTVTVEMGSLLPVTGSPLYRRLTRDRADALRRNFSVALDGQTVVSSTVDFYDSASHEVYYGVDPVPNGAQFTGEIRAIERLPDSILLTPAPEPGIGPLRLRVILPEFGAGLVEPLVATGRPGAGNVLYVIFQDPGHIRLGFDQWERGTIVSYPIAAAAGEPHMIEFTAGTLFPPADHPFFAGMNAADRAARQNSLEVRFDGKLILYKLMDFGGIPFGAPVVGYNSVRSSACAASFTGLVISQERLERQWYPPPEASETTYGPVSMNVTFPSDRLGRQEPLVVTGEPGRGDFLYVVYLDPTHIRIGFDHWGVPGAISEPIPVAYDQACNLVLAMGSLYPPAGDPRLAALPPGEAERLKHTVQVQLDGRVVFEVRRSCYDATPSEVHVALNPLGGSTCDATFNGALQASERLPIAPLPPTP